MIFQTRMFLSPSYTSLTENAKIYKHSLSMSSIQKLSTLQRRRLLGWRPLRWIPVMPRAIYAWRTVSRIASHVLAYAAQPSSSCASAAPRAWGKGAKTASSQPLPPTLGTPVKLPSSFRGGPRSMQQNYQDAVALVGDLCSAVPSAWARTLAMRDGSLDAHAFAS